MSPTLRQIETPKRLSKQQKTNRLVALIFSGKTNMTENAKTLGIGRATGYRYWNQWVESEEAQQIDVEWWATFKQLKKKSPIKAFEGLTRLKIRKTPKKKEAKTETTIESKQEVTFNFDELNEDEREFCRNLARRYIKRNNQKRSTAIH